MVKKNLFKTHPQVLQNSPTAVAMVCVTHPRGVHAQILLWSFIIGTAMLAQLSEALSHSSLVMNKENLVQGPLAASTALGRSRDM